VFLLFFSKREFAMNRQCFVRSAGLAALLTLCCLGNFAQAQTTYYWDTVGNSGTITGGSGTWSTTASSWSTTLAGDASLSVWPSASSGYSAEFTTGGGTVNVSGTVNVDNITFDAATTGYTLSGGTINLNPSNANITANTNATIGSQIVGTQLVQQGPGTLYLTNSANSISGGNGVQLNSTNGGVLNFVNGALGGATVSFNGGTLQWAVGNSQDISANINIGGAGQTAYLDTNGNNVAFNHAIGGSGALTKLGAGSLLLAGGVATYSGLTTVSNGTLEMQNAFFNNANGASIASGATLQFDFSSNSKPSNNSTISGNGTLLKTGAGAMFLSSNNGHLTMSMGAGGLIDIENGALVNDNGNVAWTANRASVNLSSSGMFDIRVQNISIDALTGSGTIGNSFAGCVLSVGTAGGSGTFYGTIVGNGTGIGGGTPAPGYNLNAGTLSLNKVGAGIEALNGNNTYSGTTTVSAGTLAINGSISGGAVVANGGVLQLNSPGAMPATTAIVASGGTLDLGGNTFTQTGPITFSGGVVQDGSLSYAGTYSGTAGTVSANLSGAAVLNKTGGGTLLLTGTNTYSGGTVIASNGGTLLLGAASAISPNGIYTVNVNNGLAFGTGVTAGTISGLSGNGGVTLTTADNMPVALSINSAAGAPTYSGALSGIGSLIKVGTGVQCLSGVASYSGPTTISTGTLEMENVLFSNTSTASIAPGATLQFDVPSGNNPTPGNSFTIAGSGTLLKTGPGGLVLGGNNGHVTMSMGASGLIDIENGAVLNDYSNVVWTANQASLNLSSSGMFDLRGQNLPIGALTGSGTVGNTTGTSILTFGAGDSSGVFSGTIVGNNGTVVGGGSDSKGNLNAGVLSVTKTGNGIETLDGNNTYSGGTTIDAGTLNIASDSSLGTTGNVTFGGNSTLQAGAANITLNSSRTVTLNSGVTGTIDTQGNNMTFASNVNGAGNLTKVGGGSLFLGGIIAYTGSTTVSAGTLELENTVFNNANGASIAPGATLQVDLSTANWTVSTNFPISGSGTLLKTGSNVMILGANGNHHVTMNMGAGGLIDIENGGMANDYGAVDWSANQASMNIASIAFFDIRAQYANIGALTGSGSVGSSYGGGVVLTLGAGGSSGTFSGTIMGNGTGSNSPSPGVTANLDAGSISVTKTGNGIEVFTGNNAYSGITTVNAGGLAVNGSLASNGTVIVNGGLAGTLSGAGSVGNVTAYGNGAALAPGYGGIGTLTAASVTLNSGSLLNYTLGSVGAGGNSMLNITGGLTLSSSITLNVTPVSGWGNGTYELASYAGSLADNSTSFSGWTVAGTGLGSHTYSFSDSGGMLDVIVGAAGPTTVSGTWTNTANVTTSWTNGGNWAGSLVPTTTGDTALFGPALTSGTASVTMDGNHTLSALAFSNTNGSYSIVAGSGGTLTLANTGSAAATISNSGGSHSIGAPVALGSNLAVAGVPGSTLTLAGPVTEINAGTSLNFSGGGTLVLSGSDSYSGGTTVNSGTLGVTSSQALPTTGVLVVGRNGYVVLGNTLGAAAIVAASPLASESISLAATPALSSVDSGAAAETSSPAVQVSVPVGAPISGGAAAVPEPGTVLLLLAGAVALAVWRRKKGLGIRD
jgi:autotransporter-associated beta strand protein